MFLGSIIKKGNFFHHTFHKRYIFTSFYMNSRFGKSKITSPPTKFFPTLVPSSQPNLTFLPSFIVDKYPNFAKEEEKILDHWTKIDAFKQ